MGKHEQQEKITIITRVKIFLAHPAAEVTKIVIFHAAGIFVLERGGHFVAILIG